MLIIDRIEEMRHWVLEKKKEGKEIGFVPTMGYLHEGHLSLVKAALKENDLIVMSIFVNPLQFGPKEDYATYPRDIKRDSDLAEKAGANVIFAPEVKEMYPSYPLLTKVEIEKITEGLCGRFRQGHFSGVATVVSKLFNIIQPQRAYFGEKDYQQLKIIQQMVHDLNIPVTIRPVPIMREEDGLAMSSRNIYLSVDERRQALCLHDALELCRNLYQQGERQVKTLTQAMKERILQEPLAAVDYVEIRDAQTLTPLTEINGNAVVALAVKIGKTRLIDNLVLEGL